MTQPQDSKKVPKKSLLVTVSYNPEIKDYKDYILSAGIEYFGIWMEAKKTSTNKVAMAFLFEKIVNGEDFYQVFSNTILEVSKEEC